MGKSSGALQKRVHNQKVLERWEQALEGKVFEHQGQRYQFSVMGAFAEGGRPKIGLIILDDCPEPYATITHNEPEIPLEDDQILVRYDGHHATGANVAMASGLFEEVESDHTLLGPSGIWRLKGGLP